MITRLGIKVGDLILEIGEDGDCDQELRNEIFATSGNQPVGDDDGEVVDVVLLWWREEDGDLVDALVDSLTFLAVNGVIWLLTPKISRPGHVEPSDIQDGAPTAGLTQASSFAVCSDWTATKLMAPKAGRR